MLTSKAGAKESMDLSKALSASTVEQQSAELETKTKVRVSSRRPASDDRSKTKIVVDTSNITN